VARVLGAMIRQNDLLVRMGGDEFLLVLPDTKFEDGCVLAHRLCRAVNGLGISGLDAGPASRLGISIGLSQWKPGCSMEEWLQEADEQLYKAKAAGKDRVFAG
jgi:diguanylate cyclase (GGDEF)-like protein